MKNLILINLFLSFNSMALDLTRPYSPSITNAAFRSINDINDKLKDQREESNYEYSRKQKENESSSSQNKSLNNENDLPICFETTISNFSYEILHTKHISKKYKSEPVSKENFHPDMYAQIYYFEVPEEKLPHINWPHTSYDFENCKMKGDFKRFSYFPSKWIYEGITTCDLVFYRPKTAEEIKRDNCKAVQACPATKKYKNMDQVIAARLTCNEKPSKPTAIYDSTRGATKPHEVIHSSFSESRER